MVGNFRNNQIKSVEEPGINIYYFRLLDWCFNQWKMPASI